jgi:hypothetical protein
MLEWWNLPKGEVLKRLWSEVLGHGHGLGYIEGEAKIKRRLASEPWEASAWSFLMLKVLATRHGGRQLMKIEQVAETLAKDMNVRHGGSGKQSAQDRPLCRFS